MVGRGDIKEEILSRIDLVDFVSEVVELRRRGSNYVGLCPFHSEKTPSFTVSSEKGIYKCFGCGAAGNAITFAMNYYGLTFKEALKELADRVGIVIPKYYAKDKQPEEKDICLNLLEVVADYYNSLLKAPAGRKAYNYLIKRGYNFDTIQLFKLGYSPNSYDETIDYLKKKGFAEKYLIKTGLVVKSSDSGEVYDRFRDRLMFPIHNILGKVVGFGARILVDDDNQPKYINSPQTEYYDKSSLLYGLFQGKNEIRAKKYAILVEGYADVISLHQAGFKTAVASSGTSLTNNQLRLLSRYCKKLYICYDSDEAGKKATQKAIEQAVEFGFDIKIIKLPEGEDPDSIVQKLGVNVFRSYIENALDVVEFIIDLEEKEGSLSSPAEKSKVAKYLASLIVKIPDKFQHDDYLRKMCFRLKLTDRQSEQIYNYAYNVTKKAKVIADDDLMQKVLGEGENADKVILEMQKENTQLTPSFDASQMLLEEKWLLNAMIDYAETYSILINNFQFRNDNLFSEGAKRVFETIRKYMDKGEFSLSLLCSDEDVSEAEKQVIINIVMENNQPSEHWKRFRGKVEKVDLVRAIRECLIKIEIHKINLRLEESHRMLLSSENANTESILSEIQLLNKKKVKLLDLLNTV